MQVSTDLLGIRQRRHPETRGASWGVAGRVQGPSVPPAGSRGIRPRGMMEKRVLLAALISAVFLAWYAKALTPAPKPASPTTDTAGQETAAPEPVLRAAEPSIYPLEEEPTASIQSPDLAVEFGASSGAIRRVTLKRFLDETGSRPLEILSNLNLLHLRFGQDKSAWRLLNHSETSATFEASSGTNNYHITYTISPHNPVVDIVLTHIQNSGKSIEYLVITSTWLRSDKLNGQRNPLELIVLEEVNDKRKYKRYNFPIKQEKIVPRGTFLLSLAERYFCQSIKAEFAPGEVTLLPSPDGTAAAEMRIPLDQLEPGSSLTIARAYFGARDYFQLQRAGLSDAFPIGILGQIGLILLTALSFIAGITKNYGVAIILFSAAITCAMAPFTVLSFKSMKKMQELKPQIDRLMAQHKGDPTKANKEVFGLYKQHRVSPLSGCLPMLLQMPIFIAMFNAISHFIELRGRSFLWIKDLSLPDRLAQLPFSIPLIGNEFNLLPIIMAAVMYVQSRMSQVTTAQDQSNPAMKMMSGPTMSIVFGFMFYQFPSGLVLYWLTNSVTSLAWYKMAK